MRDLGAGIRVLARIPIPMSRTQMMTTAQVMIRILHLILALSLALTQKETEKKILGGKRYRVSDKKSGRGCKSGFWLWGHSLEEIVFGMPLLPEM